MSPKNPEAAVKAAGLIEDYTARGWTIATAESCTGGLIAGALTDVAGSSAVFDRGFVTYSNRAKREMLGVAGNTLDRHGAVSQQVAVEMAEGARTVAGVTVAIAVTGVAGPGGGSRDKPVGLVHFACAGPNGTTILEKRFGDTARSSIRQETVSVALDLLREATGLPE